MKPAWFSYMKKILWRYPKNHPRENEAIKKAIEDGAPELITRAYIEKTMDYKSAARELNLSDLAADSILEDFLLKIGDNLNLPRDGKGDTG